MKRILLVGFVLLCSSTAAYASEIYELPVPVQTIIGECAGCDLDGMQAVANVIRNRAELRRMPVDAVCLQRWQFSCWNGGTARLGAFIRKNRAVVDDAYTAWQLSASEDLTGGSDHYFADYIKRPSWSKDMKHMVTIGKHLFYKA